MNNTDKRQILNDYCNLEMEEKRENNNVTEFSEEYPFFPDTVKMFLNNTRKYPLLTPEQEIELGKRISRGDTEAKNILVSSNLRLVVSIAKKYVVPGVSMEDLIQEGNIGLMKAADRFDYSKGYKFSTYATWWIKQAIQRSIADTGRAIRIPVHMYEKIISLRKAEKEFFKEYGWEATDVELQKRTGYPLELIAQIRSFSMADIVSLDNAIGEDGDMVLGDLLPDLSQKSIEEQVETGELTRIMSELMDIALTQREKIVLEKRFGFNDTIPMTLEEVGAELGVTRERIRQIEKKAIRKLKLSRKSKVLKGYISDEQFIKRYRKES